MKKLTLLLATTVLSSAAVPAHAAKEPEIYFYPAKTWTIGHASENSTSCAVQREFNNGFVLQFDGAEKNVQSFTVNFRQNLFNEGQSYNVGLTVPGKTSQHLQATATSPTMLTIPLQSAGEIYKGARDSAAIDVAIDDNNFRYYLVNFAPAAGSFENCIQTGKLTPPQAPAPAAAPAPAQKKAQPNQQPIEQREVSNAIPQGAAAPPPPNASAIDIQTTATLTESMEMERRELDRGGEVAITEITPENPKATIQEIPYTETVKLGDQVVTKDAQAPSQDRPDLKEKPYRKRMSEQLAEQMSSDPGVMAGLPADDRAPAPSPAQNNAPVEEVKQERIAAEPINDGAISDERIQQAIEPTIEEPKSAALVTPPPSAPVATPEPATIEAPSQAQAFAAQKPQEPPQEGAPFASHGEFIDTDTPGAKPSKQAKAPEPIKAEPAPQPEPIKQARVESMKSPEPVIHKETYEMDADFRNLSQVEPASQEEIRAEVGAPFQNTPNAPRKADPDMLRKISELESQVSKLQNENSKLNSEIETNVTSAEQERVSIASDNWNLEHATLRYNEAERQIKRLGEQIRRERALCQGDKKDLEAQLFDPQITEQQQLARLADLEQKLAQAEQQIEDQRMRYEDRIRILQGQSATQ
jgi:hypothetical protein